MTKIIIVLNKKILNKILPFVFLTVFLIAFLILFVGDVNAIYCEKDSECPAGAWCYSGDVCNAGGSYCDEPTNTCKCQAASMTDCNDGFACSSDWCSGGSCRHCTIEGQKKSGSCVGISCCSGCYYNQAPPDSDDSTCAFCDHHDVQLTAGTGQNKCEENCGADSRCDELAPFDPADGGYCNKDCDWVSSRPRYPNDCLDEGDPPIGNFCCSGDCKRYQYYLDYVDYGKITVGGTDYCTYVGRGARLTRTEYATSSCKICESLPGDDDFVGIDTSNYCGITDVCEGYEKHKKKYRGCQIGTSNCDLSTDCSVETEESCDAAGLCCDLDHYWGPVEICKTCPCADECKDPTPWPLGCCSGLIEDTSASSPICIKCNGKKQASTSACDGADKCEEDCGALSECDELSDTSLIPYCNKAGTTWFRDNCAACSGSDEDNICRSSGSIAPGDGCTASTECNNNQIFTCEDQTGYCGNSCLYETAEISEQGCNCDVCGADNNPAPGCVISDANENPWDGAVWKGDINQKCCGNDVNEYTKNPVCVWDCSSQLGAPIKKMDSCGGHPEWGSVCYRISLKTCCDNLNDCAWKDGGAERCYSDGSIITDQRGNNITCVIGTWYDTPYFGDGEVEAVFYFSGDLKYFNSFWTLNYPYLKRSAGVKCGLDCDPSVGCLANSQCIPYPYEQDPGRGTCAVPNPNYKFTEPNNVTCLVYDTALPQIYSFYTYAFKTIDFAVSVSPTITTTVGEEFTLPINVKNLGLLTDNYTVAVIPTASNIISIEKNYSVIRNVKTNDIGDAYARIRLLAAVPTSIRINVTSLTSCQYSPQGCISKEIVVNIQGGMHSLPEFELIGIIQIVIIATIVFALVNLKKIKIYL